MRNLFFVHLLESLSTLLHCVVELFVSKRRVKVGVWVPSDTLYSYIAVRVEDEEVLSASTLGVNG